MGRETCGLWDDANDDYDADADDDADADNDDDDDGDPTL